MEQMAKLEAETDDVDAVTIALAAITGTWLFQGNN